MTTSRKHLIAALALALPVAAFVALPASAATAGVHHKKHHVAAVHHISTHHHVTHSKKKHPAAG